MKIKYISILIYITFVVVFINILIYLNDKTNQDLPDKITFIDDDYNGDFNRYIMLIYGKFYEDDLFPELDSNECELREYFVIKRSNFIEYFDILVIHFIEYRNLNTSDMRFNTKKLIIIFSLESPYSVNSKSQLDFDFEQFNYLSISYLRSSFYHIPYGLYWYNNNTTKYNESEIYYNFKHKSPNIFTLVSNCEFPNILRIEFILKFDQDIPIDKYGSCFLNQITPTQRTDLFNTNMFFLALENSICKEYVTEKYWDSITKDTIPIIYPHKDSYNTIIPGSYIDISKYNSIKNLTNEIKLISSNYSHYKKYFEWKKKYSFSTMRTTTYMNKCIFLTNLYNYITNNKYIDNNTLNINNINLCIPTEEQYEFMFNYFK